MDYLDQLSEEELAWMNDFMSEYNNAAVKGVKDKTNETAKKNNKFHKTAAEAKTCTDRNNARNRDMYSIAKAQNMVHKESYDVLASWIEEMEPVNTNYMEDVIIEALDDAKELSDTAEDTDDNSNES